jgi:hypothetical protein
MSNTFSLYVVDELKLPAALSGSDQDKYEALVAAVGAHGGRWGTLVMDASTLAKALETIDAQFGSTGFLPVFAFNNSPHNLLGNYGACPCFGYFSPDQARDLYILLKRIAPDAFGAIPEEERDTVEGVLYEFEIAASEAASHGMALAVLHA